MAFSLGCEGISKSQVSRVCAELDEVVDSPRRRHTASLLHRSFRPQG